MNDERLVTQFPKFDFPKAKKKKDKLGDEVDRLVRSRFNNNLECRFDRLCDNLCGNPIAPIDRSKANDNGYIFEQICEYYKYIISNLNPVITHVPYDCIFSIFKMSVDKVAKDLNLTNRKVKEAIEYGSHSARSRVYINICNIYIFHTIVLKI